MCNLDVLLQVVPLDKILWAGWALVGLLHAVDPLVTGEADGASQHPAAILAIPALSRIWHDVHWQLMLMQGRQDTRRLYRAGQSAHSLGLWQHASRRGPRQDTVIPPTTDLWRLL